MHKVYHTLTNVYLKEHEGGHPVMITNISGSCTVVEEKERVEEEYAR